MSVMIQLLMVCISNRTSKVYEEDGLMAAGMSGVL